MRVLVTGAAGSLGRKLVEHLISDKSISVFATDIKPNPFSKHENLCYKTFDLRAPELAQWLVAIEPTCVVHLASVLQLSPSLTRDIAYQIDVVATKNLLEVSVSLGVEKFIITTSGAAYGYYPQNRDIITEQRQPRGNQDYFYSAHKAEVERLMAQYRASNPQLKQIVFRPGAILGPEFEGPVVNLFQQKIITGILGYPAPFNFIWSSDVVALITEGLSSDVTGEFNVAGTGSLSLRQIAQRLNKRYLALPEWLIKAVLTIAKPLGLTQYGPEQVKFIKYRPVLDNTKLQAYFNHQLRYNSSQALDAFLQSMEQKS